MSIKLMSMKRAIMLAAVSAAMSGCINTKSSFMDATGAKEGDLPQVERPEFKAAQQAFRTKLAEFRRTGTIPTNTTNFVECKIADATLQDIAGYKDVLRSVNKSPDKEDPDSGSLASAVANDSGRAGSSVSSAQSYHWHGAALLAPSDMCQGIAENYRAAGLTYIINSEYQIRTAVNTSVSTHTMSSQTYVENLTNDSRRSMTISSMSTAGGIFDTFTHKAVVSMNNLHDPSFNYRFAITDHSITMIEMASTPGVYQTQIATDLGDGRTRTYSYAGSEMTIIHRSRNGRPHGLQEFIKFNIPASCYDNGEVVVRSDCERF
jgi:hypothetical protein